MTTLLARHKGMFISAAVLVAIAIAVVLIARNASNNTKTIPNSPALPSGAVKDSFDTLQKLLQP